MTEIAGRLNLAQAPDFEIGGLRVSPSACRVLAGGNEVRVEAQTMVVLVVLARAGGATVSRDDLINACWQGRIVSDDAISRTIAKVRALAKAASPAPFVLETVPKVGYRLLAREGSPEASADAIAKSLPAPRRLSWRMIATAAAVAVVIPVVWAMMPKDGAPGRVMVATSHGDLPTAKQVSEALTLLDRQRVQDYLARGWDPNWKLDPEGSGALSTLFMACERDPGHDQAMVATIAKMLVQAGANAIERNKWDDSPLDIAISPRYCGPHHPVVDYLKTVATAENVRAVMERACAEAFGGRPSQANWAKSDLTRADCASALVPGP